VDDYDSQSYWEINLSARQWAKIPTSASPWHNPEAGDPVRESRKKTVEEVSLLLHGMIVAALTPRQREVVDLYYFENLTQAEIAHLLGISQPTVSQHLRGKAHAGKSVGGAFLRLRKAIHKAAARQEGTAPRHAQIIRALDQLLDSSITRRRARRLLDDLARPDEAHMSNRS